MGNRYKRRARLNWARYCIKRHVEKHRNNPPPPERCDAAIENEDARWACTEPKGHGGKHLYAKEPK